MRILIVTQIYLPEMGALSNRIYPIIRQLVNEGHEVSVATGMPNYPAGKVFPDYRGKLWMTETMDGYTILRTHYYTVPRNRSRRTQLASYLTFMPAAFLSGMRVKKPDVVLITSPPMFSVIPAILLAKLRGAKLILDVRDIWSDELVAYGEMSETSFPVRLARAIENWSYRHADLITATSNSLGKTVSDRGATAGKIFFLPNGADLELFTPLPRDNPIVKEYPFGNRFVVMYAGLFGIKHGLETLLEAAEILRKNKDICFFMIGNGARQIELRQIANERKLTNVIIADERRVQDIPNLLARADVCFGAVRPEPYPKKVISVKVFEYMACEKAVVGALSGESAKVLKESGGGIVVPPGDARATAGAILRLYNDPALRAKMGNAGRTFVENNFSRSDWAKRFSRVMVNLFNSESAISPVNADTNLTSQV